MRFFVEFMSKRRPLKDVFCFNPNQTSILSKKRYRGFNDQPLVSSPRFGGGQKLAFYLKKQEKPVRLVVDSNQKIEQEILALVVQN
jgi:hypothetical protein